MEAKFDLGPVVATPGALRAFEKNSADPSTYLRRHLSGDWGDLCDEDKSVNESALVTGARILSAYTLPDGTKFWIITDAVINEQGHRYATTLLLPDEY